MSEFDLNPEPFIRRWGRRTLSVSFLLLMASLSMALLPLALCAAVGVDLYRKRGWIVVRTVLFFAYYLLVYTGVLLAILLQWVFAGTWAGASPERLARWSRGLALLWGSWLYHGAARVFRVQTEMEGEEVLDGGPYLLFLRHVSVGDTLIPYTFVSGRHGVHFRYVLKTELLLDPCVDIAGHRWKNVFVRRGSGDSENEIALLRKVVTGLADNEGVAIWPEGTRFTLEKREQILASVARKSPEIYREVSALKNVLPPHLGGPLELLERNERADAVFCAHAGLEATQHIRSFFNGSVIGTTVRIRFWRVPYRDIPEGREERIKWLLHWWKVVDGWIGEARG
jgi:1-acyl-sn-glycerol-3-phosphate acyltransferase